MNRRLLQKTFALIVTTALATIVTGTASAQNNDNRNRGWDMRSGEHEARQTERRTITVVCESIDDRRHRCPADTLGQITLGRQLSRKSACVQGRTWGYDKNAIWVDHGCRAEFLIADNRGMHRDHGPSQATQTIRCESNSKRRTFCAAENHFGVTLSRELSRNNCVARRTWGSDDDGIWVSNGCRAEFTYRTRL